MSWYFFIRKGKVENKHGYNTISGSDKYHENIMNKCSDARKNKMPRAYCGQETTLGIVER